jgi:thioredoxin reductase
MNRYLDQRRTSRSTQVEHFPMQSMGTDQASVAGKAPPVSEHTDLLVIGAGPAGLAAALAAAGHGLRVTLVDENPVPFETMGEEVPLQFGGRMGRAVANRNAMLEQMLEANPALFDAVEAGVDVRLGTAAWGLFPQRPGAAWIDGKVVGLADAERTYLMGFEQVIVAAGRRDMGLAFPGWERPGVMGASAAHRLATVYGALSAREAVLVGSDSAALQIGVALIEYGVRIVAIVEQAEAVIGDAALLASLVSQGAQVFTRHVIRQAEGDENGVTAVSLVAVDAAGKHLAGDPIHLACDSVLLGIAAIPAIELLEAAGCALSYRDDRGGHVPTVDAWQRTSLLGVFAVGDCTGTWAAKSLSAGVAAQEGRYAAKAALADMLGTLEGLEPPTVGPRATTGEDLSSVRCAWVRASVVEAEGAPHVCQCEEVTAAEILNVRPPRYLSWKNAQKPLRDLVALADGGAPHPDAVKRLTRAGMGPCQGRRCREQVGALLSLGSGVALARVPVASFRSPVRPLSLRQMAELDQAPAMTEHWDSWFGMASQWVPFWQVPGQYTAAGREVAGPVASE